MLVIVAFALLVLLGLSNFAIRVQAGDGDLDLTFNGTGKVTTHFLSDDRAFAVAMQADGKIIAAGVSLNGSNNDFALVRYNSNGSLDMSFGSSGQVVTPVGNSNDFARALAIQSDGRIVVAGYSYSGTDNDFAVVRYNPDGALDTSFGSGGKVTTQIGSASFAPDDEAYAVAIQTDGKIVVAGTSKNGATWYDFAVARYNTNGSLDVSFGSGGTVTTAVGPSTADDRAYALAIQADGKIVTVGDGGGSYGDVAVVRYNPNGSPDTSFGLGGTGIVLTPIGENYDNGRAVAIQTDGKIVAAGYFLNSIFDHDFAVLRYNTNGSLDASFGLGGKVTTSISDGSDIANAVAIQTDGKIVAVGYEDLSNGDFELVRYNSDGSVDTSFGLGGKVSTSLGSSDVASAVAIQPDGKIVAAGYAFISSTGYDFAVVRYDGPTPQCDTVSFAAATNFAAGSGPVSVAVGDLNGDGNLDLAVANNGSANVSILLGTGTGSFSTATNFAAGSGPYSVAVGDFNRDGKLDLAVANNGSANVSILLGTGTGNFTAAINFAAGSGPLSVAVGDFNGDGNLDLAVANDGSANVSILLGTGTGSFTAATNFAAGSGPDSVAVGDFNGDGKLDLVVVNLDSNNISILLGTGTGSFSAATNFPAGSSPVSVAVGDFSGDGKLDLAVANYFSFNVSILQGTGTGSFNAATNFAAGSRPQFVTVGDFNGNGKLDLAVADFGTNNVSILLGIGTGSFNAATNFAAGSGPLSVAVGDLNGDGKLDLAVANFSSASVSILLNNGAICPGANPIDQADFFVRQHYIDFLNREPDSSGLAFWTNEITSCGSDAQCIEIKRINVSAAFYLSIEFQQTGYLVERIYKAAYGDANGTSTLGGTHQLSVPIIRLNEFLPDTRQIGNGVIVNQPGWEQVLENNKQAFTTEFVQRSRFTTAFPTSMTPAQFVDTLNTNAGNPLSPSERNQLVTDLTSGAKTRAQVLRAVAEDPDLNSAESNRAFVLMQYFGYLRRNPNDPQDSDYTGYDFWLTKLNDFNGNFINAEMVKAFITSIEYRERFGP